MQDNDNLNKLQKQEISENDNLPQEVENILNTLPDDQKATLLRQFSISISSMGIKREVPYERIMTKEHLSTILENADKDSQREFEDKKLNKIYLFLTLIISLIFVSVLVFGLIDKNPKILTGILSYSGTLIVGLCGGYGIRRKMEE